MRKIYSMGWALAVVLSLCSVPLFAQTLRVSGVVTDETGQAVPGVSIIEKGTSNGVTTDNDGRYALNVADGNPILVFSFIGYFIYCVAAFSMQSNYLQAQALNERVKVSFDCGGEVKGSFYATNFDQNWVTEQPNSVNIREIMAKCKISADVPVSVLQVMQEVDFK